MTDTFQVPEKRSTGSLEQIRFGSGCFVALGDVESRCKTREDWNLRAIGNRQRLTEDKREETEKKGREERQQSPICMLYCMSGAKCKVKQGRRENMKISWRRHGLPTAAWDSDQISNPIFTPDLPITELLMAEYSRLIIIHSG